MYTFTSLCYITEIYLNQNCHTRLNELTGIYIKYSHCHICFTAYCTNLIFVSFIKYFMIVLRQILKLLYILNCVDNSVKLALIYL